MKRARRILLAVAALAMLFSIGVFAENQYVTYEFDYNGQKIDSNRNYKANDGDMLAYVTTLESRNGVHSNVIEHGGVFYARSRWTSNTNIYSGLFAIDDYDAYTQPYSSNVVFGSYYLLKAETDYAQYDYQVPLYQVVRWCP